LFDFQHEEEIVPENTAYPDSELQGGELNRGLILLIVLIVSVVGASWLFLLPASFDIKIIAQLMPLLLASILLFLISRVKNAYLNTAVSGAAYLFSFASWSYVVHLNFILPVDELSQPVAQFSGISNSMYLIGLCFLILWANRYIAYAHYLSITSITALILLLLLFSAVPFSFLLAILLLTGCSVAMAYMVSSPIADTEFLAEDAAELFNEDLLLTAQADIEEEITPELEIDVMPLNESPVMHDWERILRTLNGELKNTADVDQLFKRMLIFLHGTMQYDGAAVGMLQDNSIKKIASYGSDELLDIRLLSWTNQRVKAVFSSREPVISKQARVNTQGLNTAIDELLLHRMDIPVLSGQKVVGLVTLFREGEIFDTNDVQLTASVVFHSMIALREARLQLEVKRLSSASTPTKLTLYSREQFVSKVKPVFKKLGKPRECSLFIAEIDNFDEVVDDMGRDAGAVLYKAVSKTIISELQSEDILGSYGKEGFIILLDETDMNHAKAIADKIRIKVSKIKLTYQDFVISTTLSIGLTIVSEEEDLPTLMRKADMGLFIAKENGRNTVKVSL